MIQVETERGCTVVTVYGDVTIANIRHLCAVLGYVDLASYLVVSFKKDRETDATLIHVLLDQYEKRNGRLIVVAPLGSSVNRTLTFARLHSDRLRVVDDKTEAVAGLGLLELVARGSSVSSDAR